jgi:FkbM family methyltransferase
VHAVAPSTFAPWYWRLAVFLVRNQYRGGWRLLQIARRLGLLEKVVRVPIPGGSLDVPLYRECNEWWDESYVSSYEAAFVATLAAAATSLPQPVELIDCGADIGIFSALFAARFPRLRRITAFEPNGDALPLLTSNLRRLPAASAVRQAGVSDFRGRGRLETSPLDPTDSAKFIVRDADGQIAVERVDDLGIADASVVLKIDVEGGEIDVLRGALETLRNAPGFAVGFEAHRDVVGRTGVDPCACIRLLQSIRPVGIEVAEEHGRRIDPARPFFDQVGESKVYNVVCSTG